MDRHSFLWPVAAERVRAVVNALPNCVYWDPVAAGVPSFQPEIQYTRVADGAVLHCWLFPRLLATPIPHLGDSAGVNQLWDVLQVTPRFVVLADGTIERPRNLGTRVLHMLGQFILNHPNLNQDGQGRPWTGLPMSFAEVVERYPATEAVFGTPPLLNPTPAGLDPAAGAAVDYRPTTGEIQADNDIPDGLWP